MGDTLKRKDNMPRYIFYKLKKKDFYKIIEATPFIDMTCWEFIKENDLEPLEIDSLDSDIDDDEVIVSVVKKGVILWKIPQSSNEKREKSN